MDIDTLLEKVKQGLNADDNDDNDATLKIKILGVKQYILSAGVSIEQFESDLGITALTIGVNDIWNLEPGTIKFSSLFHTFLIQLATKDVVT